MTSRREGKAMKILAIGGTNFIGPPVVRQLVAAGHELTLFHRGKTEADLPKGVQHILCDRTSIPTKIFPKDP